MQPDRVGFCPQSHFQRLGAGRRQIQVHNSAMLRVQRRGRRVQEQGRISSAPPADSARWVAAASAIVKSALRSIARICAVRLTCTARLAGRSRQDGGAPRACARSRDGRLNMHHIFHRPAKIRCLIFPTAIVRSWCHATFQFASGVLSKYRLRTRNAFGPITASTNDRTSLRSAAC